jgi:cell division protein FtsB
MKIGWYFVVFLFLMTLLITFGNRGVVDNYSMEKKLAHLNKENNKLENQNRELGKKILLLRSDPAYIEAIARNELGMVKEGDVVYRLAK